MKVPPPSSPPMSPKKRHFSPSRDLTQGQRLGGRSDSHFINITIFFILSSFPFKDNIFMVPFKYSQQPLSTKNHQSGEIRTFILVFQTDQGKKKSQEGNALPRMNEMDDQTALKWEGNSGRFDASIILNSWARNSLYFVRDFVSMGKCVMCTAT